MRIVTEQRGSLPLVLLVSILIGAVVIVLWGVVRSGQTTARADRDFAAAVHVADAGLQEAFVQLREIDPDDAPACDATDDGACEGSLQDGSSFTWTYERIGERLWTVTSRGEFGGAVRVLQAEIGERQLFGAAIISDTGFDYNGGGTGTEPFPMGGFNRLTFTGNTGDYIETLYLYGEDNEPDGPGAPDADSWERAPGPSLPNLAAKEFDEGGVCEGRSDGTPESVAYGGVYCLTGLWEIKEDIVLAGDPTDGPAEVFIERGGLSVGPRQVNHGGDAVNLQIYVAAGDVTMHGNFNVSAAIYAPQSSCYSNGQGGGGFAGGMVCNTVTLRGNMRYDPTVTQIMDDTFSIRGWREEPGLVAATG